MPQPIDDSMLTALAVKKFTDRSTGIFHEWAATKWFVNNLSDEGSFNGLCSFARTSFDRYFRQLDREASESRHSLFPDLHRGYTLVNGEGHKVRKLTDKLTLKEFEAIIKRQREQIEYDQASNRAHLRVLDLLAPIWRTMPEKTFAEVTEIYQRRPNAVTSLRRR